LSIQQLCLIDTIMKTKLLLDSVDNFLLRQTNLVNKRKKSLYSVVVQRGVLADSLLRHLSALGLEKKAKDGGSLRDLLESGNGHGERD